MLRATRLAAVLGHPACWVALPLCFAVQVGTHGSQNSYQFFMRDGTALVEILAWCAAVLFGCVQCCCARDVPCTFVRDASRRAQMPALPSAHRMTARASLPWCRNFHGDHCTFADQYYKCVRACWVPRARGSRRRQA